MGNPHHNTWGGKNNTWGNRNKKNKNSSPQYKESKLFKTIAITALAVVLLTGAFNTIKELYDNIIGKAKDTIETVEKVKDKVTNKSSDANADNKTDISIDTDDIIL